MAQGETLFRIALRFRRPGVTVAQTMMAIFETNPDAFDQGNINRLKVGAVLRIPDAADAARLTPRQAHREATGQIRDYESEQRDRRVQRGELAPLATSPREPDLDTGIVIPRDISEPDSPQFEQMRRQLDDEQPAPLAAAAGVALPEPKPGTVLPERSSGEAFRWSYDVSAVSDDNIRLARDDDDIREDSILSFMVRAQKGVALNDDFALFNYGGRATYNRFSDFDTLNNLEYEINARFRFALNSGFTSPIYSIAGALGGVDYDTEMRDSTLLKLDLGLNRWLTNTINMTAGLGLHRRESVSEVFDLSEFRLFVNFDTELSKTDLVYATLTWINGDTASSAAPSVDIVNASDAIEPDDAFGGLASNQFAYRIEAETRVLTLGYNRIMTPSLSLDVSARVVSSEATEDSNVYYDRTILRASLLGRF